MDKHITLLAACGALAVAPTVSASAAEASGSEMSNDTIALSGIEVAANRAAANTPVAFTVVSRAEIERVNDGRDIPFLLSMTPSLTSTSDAGAGVGYSGLRIRGIDASRINVTANGVPINDGESHNVYWVNMPDLASSLRDIQIQRGAGTSTNGAGAFGASVNMLTSAPSTDAYAEFSGSYGMYNTNMQSLRVGSGLLGGHWTVDARISHLGSDGYIDRASSSLWSYLGQVGYVNGGTSLRLLAFGGKEDTYMAWDYASKEEMEEYGRRYNPCGKYTASDGSTAFYPDQKDHFVQHHFQLHLGQTLGEYWRLSATAFYTKGDGHYDQYKTKRTLVEYGLDNYIDADGNEIKKSDLIRLKFNDNGFVGGNATLNYRRGRVDATLGTGISNFHGKHFGRIKWVRNYVGDIDPLQIYYNNTGNKFDANVYARADVAISRPFSAFADLQYRHINYRIDGVSDNYDWNTESMAELAVHQVYDFFNPKIGVNYTDGRHHRAFASWSVAHKEPVRDNFTDGDRNHTPRAERLFDYELGYTYSHNLFNVGVNLYYMDYKDQLVVTGQLSDTGNPLSVNVPKSYRMGIELQGALKPCKWFDWQINATLSRNRIKDFTEYIYEDEWTNPISRYVGDTPIAFSPDFLLNNSFNFHWRGLEASLESHYVSKQYMSNAHSEEQMLDAYFVSNLRLGYDFGAVLGTRGVRLGLTVYNIFNEKYCNNGYAGAGYYRGDNGEPVVYRYAGYAAQATCNVQGSINIRF
ncbi:MAG: TonB-dependent receptor [Muribaculaceae bacterium]|nr:TonB-dependent receptor [Muribaculaceae bacterium]